MKGNHIAEKCNRIYRCTSEILFKLWKIINLKTILKNEEEPKRAKDTSIGDQAGKICRGGVGAEWKSFPKSYKMESICKILENFSSVLWPKWYFYWVSYHKSPIKVQNGK